MTLILSGTDGLSDIDGTASTPAIRGTDANTGIFFPAADTIAFAEGGAEAMRIDSSGNVGIGNSTARARLTVSDGTVNTAGEAVYQAYIAGTSRTPTSDVTAMLTIQSTNALAADVGGSIAFGGRAVSASTAGANWATIAGFKENATTSEFGGYLQFATRPNAGAMSERARITSSGNLLIGATSPVASERLNVTRGGLSLRIAHFENTRNLSGDENLRTVLGSNCNNTSSYQFIGSITGTGDVIYIYGNGNIQNLNNSYGSLSDAKLKENIVDATPKLDDLMQVRVRNYNLIGSQQKQIGVVAQELEQVFPGLVDESRDKDAEGNDLGTVTKGVKYSVFVPMLVKAIQELKAINDAQAQTIESLTTRIAALEAKG